MKRMDQGRNAVFERKARLKSFVECLHKVRELTCWTDFDRSLALSILAPLVP